MNERVTLMAGSVLGAVAGVALSYLFFTPRGRALRAEIGPHLDDLVREAGRVHQAVEHFREGLAGAGDAPGTSRPSWPTRSA